MLLDQALSYALTPLAPKTASATCQVAPKAKGIRIDCSSPTLNLQRLVISDTGAKEASGSGIAITLKDNGAPIRTREFGGIAEMHTLSSGFNEVVVGSLYPKGAKKSLRLDDGSKIQSIRCTFRAMTDPAAHCVLTYVPDFEYWVSDETFNEMAAEVFSRRTIINLSLASLGFSLDPALAREMRLSVPSIFPKIEIDQTTDLVSLLGGAPSKVMNVFSNRCSNCHTNDSNSPPAFMVHPEGLEKGIENCAERIVYRLLMWDELRAGKTPAKKEMPPQKILLATPEVNHTWDQERQAVLEELLKIIATKGTFSGSPSEIRDVILNIEFSKLPVCASN